MCVCDVHSVQRRVAFSRIHEAAQSLYSGDRHCFMPGQRITVEIIKIDQTEHLQLLNRNLYALHCFAASKNKKVMSLRSTLTCCECAAKITPPFYFFATISCVSSDVLLHHFKLKFFFIYIMLAGFYFEIFYRACDSGV